MADISQITLPNGDSYNFRDASAAADMSLSGSTLSLKNKGGDTIRSVSLPSGGGGSGMSIALLWENASPASSFAAQTVSLDLSGYNAVIIGFSQTPTGTRWGSLFALKDSNDYYVTIGIDSTSNNYYYKRGAKVSDSGVTFTTGYQNTTSGAGYAIPKYIYGITF